MFAFGPFVLDSARKQLMLNGARVRIGKRAFNILLALVERQGEIVDKRDLLSRGWPDLFVDDGYLKVKIAALRRLLGEGQGLSRHIATVPGRGYRFVAMVQQSPSSSTHRLPDFRLNTALPALPRALFGRDDVIASILQDLNASRLVSIVGQGGVGKTTVAIAVASRAAETLEAGASFIDFASLTDPSDIPGILAAALGLTESASDTGDRVCEYLRDRKILLVLDNCEQQVDAIAGWADRLLRNTRAVTLLTTTREPLGVKGERVRRLLGLTLPYSSDRVPATEAKSFAAVQLFVARASESAPGFELDDFNAPIIVEICKKLDGHTLAIERVARRLSTMSIDKMLEHLEKRFHMFDGYHVGPERHRTLTASAEWSYCLLSDDEKGLLCGLSLFVGPFSLESACELAAPEYESCQVIEGVARLVSKSMLVADARKGEMEYRLMHVTRAFALDKLLGTGAFAQLRQKHAAYCLRRAKVAADGSGTLTKAEWFDRHGAQVADLQDALIWAADDVANGALAVKLGLAMIPHLESIGPSQTTFAAIERLLDETFTPHRSVSDSLALHLALGRRASADSATSAHTSLLKALELATSLGDTSSQVECIRLLGAPGAFQHDEAVGQAPAHRPQRWVR